jgi:hypothetical protein
MGCCHQISFNKDGIDSTDIFLPFVMSKNTVLKGKVYDKLIKPNIYDENTNIKRIQSISSDLAKAPTAFNSKVNLNQNLSISSQSSWNSESDSGDDNISQIHIQELSENILDLINDMRSHPQKYLNRMIKFLKPYDYKTNSLKIRNKEGITESLTNCVEPDYIISFIEKVSCKSIITKSKENHSKTLNLSFFKILESPLETLFSYLISEKGNIQEIYDENINEINISFKSKNMIQ